MHTLLKNDILINMINELVFVFQLITVSSILLGSLWMGKEALIAFVALQGILANLFVTKTTTLFGLTVTVADAFIVGGVFGLQLLQEYYGNQTAKKAIWISFGMLLFYTAMTSIVLMYLPSTTDFAHEHFRALLSIAPRLSIASLIAYFCSTQLDRFIYGFLNRYFNGHYLVARNIGCATLSQFVDTLLFSFLGLYGIVHPLLHIMIFSYGIKLLCILLGSPFVLMAKKIKPTRESVA